MFQHPSAYAPARKGLSRTFRNGNLSVICPIPAVCPCVLGRFDTAGRTARFGHGPLSCDTALQKVKGAVLEPRHTLGRPQGFQSLAPLQVGSFANCRLPKVKGRELRGRGSHASTPAHLVWAVPTYTPLAKVLWGGVTKERGSHAPLPPIVSWLSPHYTHTHKSFLKNNQHHADKRQYAQESQNFKRKV